MKNTKRLFYSFFLWAFAGLTIAIGQSQSPDEESPAATRSFQVGPYTEIKLNGEEASLSQLKVGMQAFVADDSFQAGYASSIDAHIPLYRVIPPPAAAKTTTTTAKTKAPAITYSEWIITAISSSGITVSYKHK